jgi:hypothetical protein
MDDLSEKLKSAILRDHPEEFDRIVRDEYVRITSYDPILYTACKMGLTNMVVYLAKFVSDHTDAICEACTQRNYLIVKILIDRRMFNETFIRAHLLVYGTQQDIDTVIPMIDHIKLSPRQYLDAPGTLTFP